MVAPMAGLAACTPPASEAAGKLPLTLVQDVLLPEGSTRLDYQVIDPAAKRLYVTHLGDSTVHVLDLASDHHRVLASASGTDEAVTTPMTGLA